MVAWVTSAWATDDHVVLISERGLVPSRLEVRVGERVRWQAAGGPRVRLELDPHQDEHEVVTGQGEIQAVFLTPGEHWYQVAVARNGQTTMSRGTVVVREAAGPREELPVCSGSGSTRVCFAP
jgi:plastocyanin